MISTTDTIYERLFLSAPATPAVAIAAEAPQIVRPLDMVIAVERSTLKILRATM